VASLPGCSVYDDFSHALGDPNEARLAAALSYLASNLTSSACPTPSGLGAPGSVLRFWASDGRVVKSPFVSNRILRH
jgi:carboxyl-terminal processing protease